MGLNNHIFDFHTEVAKGLVPKHSTINKFGSNSDIDTTTDPETIWSGGGLYTFPSSADTLKIVSADADDNGTGTTGALTIKVEGLDANYDVIEEDITLNGQTAVTGSKEFLRVYRAFVTSAGSSEYNEGTITINNSDDSLTLAQIPGRYSQTQMAIYTVPRNHKAYVTNLSAAIVRSGSNRHATIGFYTRKDGVKRLKQELSIETTGSTMFNKTYVMPLVIEEKTDIYMDCLEVSSNNTAIFANFGILLVDQSEKYR